MRIGIFYISLSPKPNATKIPLPHGGEVFIRVEEVDAESDMRALDMAKIEDDESLMNTHELPVFRAV